MSKNKKINETPVSYCLAGTSSFGTYVVSSYREGKRPYIETFKKPLKDISFSIMEGGIILTEESSNKDNIYHWLKFGPIPYFNTCLSNVVLLPNGGADFSENFQGYKPNDILSRNLYLNLLTSLGAKGFIKGNKDFNFNEDVSLKTICNYISSLRNPLVEFSKGYFIGEINSWINDSIKFSFPNSRYKDVSFSVDEWALKNMGAVWISYKKG